MKINEKMISIPPYLSTSWNNVAAVHMKGNILVLNLIDGDTITIPGLVSEVIDEVFLHHSLFMENLSQEPVMDEETAALQDKMEQLMGGMPFRMGIGSPDGLAMNLMQHNSAQGHSPDMPKEFLEKLASIAKAVVGEDVLSFLKPEPHCNCPHCQMARALQEEAESDPGVPSINFDEEVEDEELQFQQWDVTQNGEQLYTVVNRTDEKEKYSVFLGKPIGCTCGKENCEHIEAVLKAPLP